MEFLLAVFFFEGPSQAAGGAPPQFVADKRFAEEWPAARATQLVRDLRHAHEMGRLQIRPAAAWLDGLAA